MTEECETTGLYSTYAKLWEDEVDLEDIETEEVDEIIVHFDETENRSSWKYSKQAKSFH